MEDADVIRGLKPPWFSPKVRMSARSAVLLRRRPSFAAVARVVEVLAGDPIAAACKRTSLSLPWPGSHRAPTAGLLLQRRMAVACAETVGARVHR
jgi:hypothetical protein